MQRLINLVQPVSISVLETPSKEESTSFSGTSKIEVHLLLDTKDDWLVSEIKVHNCER